MQRLSKRTFGLLAAAITALLLLFACGTTGEIGIGKDKGTGKLWFGTSATWGVSGPMHMCGCLTWTDENGKPLDGVAPAEVKNGSGGGTVPPAGGHLPAEGGVPYAHQWMAGRWFAGLHA